MQVYSIWMHSHMFKSTHQGARIGPSLCQAPALCILPYWLPKEHRVKEKEIPGCRIPDSPHIVATMTSLSCGLRRKVKLLSQSDKLKPSDIVDTSSKLLEKVRKQIMYCSPLPSTQSISHWCNVRRSVHTDEVPEEVCELPKRATIEDSGYHGLEKFGRDYVSRKVHSHELKPRCVR